MTNSINLYLNGLGNNPFIQPTNVEEKQESNDYNFISKTYDPIIETNDEEGIVDEESLKKNETPSETTTPLQNLGSGLKTITKGTFSGIFGIVGDTVKGIWQNTGSAFSGFWKYTVGGLQVLSTPIVGLFKGIGSFYNNTVTGLKQIFHGQIFKGIGSIFKGVAGTVVEPLKWAWSGVKKMAQGVGKVVKSVGKAVVSAGKAVVNGIKKVGQAIGKGIKKIFSGW